MHSLGALMNGRPILLSVSFVSPMDLNGFGDYGPHKDDAT